MTRQRNLLHVRHLGAFTEFCWTRGWKHETLKSEYEVLRMRHASYADVLLVHRRGHTKAGNPREHLTVWGVSYRLACEFIGSMTRRQRKEVSRV